MALTTLEAVRGHLGEEIEVDNDAELLAHIRGAVALVRKKTQRFHGGVVSAIHAENPAVVVSIGHQLETGDQVKLINTNTTPSTDGEYTVTRDDYDRFSLDGQDNSAATLGSDGAYLRRVVEYHNGNNRAALVLRQRPVYDVVEVRRHNSGVWGQGTDAFADSGHLLTRGSAWALEVDHGSISKSGRVFSLCGNWPGMFRRGRGLSGAVAQGMGNLRVTYWTGWPRVHDDISLAVKKIVSRLVSSDASGVEMQSETIDYYSYTRLSAKEEGRLLDSVRSLLAGHISVIA